MTLRVVVDGAAAGERNMEADAALADALARGEIPPTLRLYGWSPPAISIGYHQSEEDFDAVKMADAGIRLVRRPTGGRAILHWEELTYAAVLPLAAGSPREIYTAIHRTFLRGVLSMGIPADLGDGDGDMRAAGASPGGIACFSTSAKSEIRSGGKKLVGSAQRKVGGVILQHGSFLLGPRHLGIAEFVRPDRRGVALTGLASRTTDAETILGRPVSFAEAAGAISAAFSGDAAPADPVPAAAAVAAP